MKKYIRNIYGKKPDKTFKITYLVCKKNQIKLLQNMFFYKTFELSIWNFVIFFVSIFVFIFIFEVISAHVDGNTVLCHTCSEYPAVSCHWTDQEKLP
jgi:hypothetical protein